MSGFRRRSGCVPAEPYPPLKQRVRLENFAHLAIAPDHYSGFDRTAVSGFDRTTTQKYWLKTLRNAGMNMANVAG